jgi:hypothetical protein
VDQSESRRGCSGRRVGRFYQASSGRRRHQPVTWTLEAAALPVSPDRALGLFIGTPTSRHVSARVVGTRSG